MTELDRAVLSLTDVSLSFASGAGRFNDGTHKVLDGVSFEVRRGETLGILGRNGCGKTTVLGVLAGVLVLPLVTFYK